MYSLSVITIIINIFNMSQLSILLRWYVIPQNIIMVISISLSLIFATQKSVCANDIMSVNTYLIGIAMDWLYSMINFTILYLFYAIIRNNQIIITIRKNHPLSILLGLAILFHYAWIIFGCIILFDTEIDCVSNPANIYALLMWIFAIGHIIYILLISDYCNVTVANGYITFTVRLKYIEYILSLYANTNTNTNIANSSYTQMNVV